MKRDERERFVCRVIRSCRTPEQLDLAYVWASRYLDFADLLLAYSHQTKYIEKISTLREGVHFGFDWSGNDGKRTV